ncbi:MAG: metallophosphoesterase [Phycisphaeraceae bacterium]|nr:metallophosphoesterase [Phycisphaeraceae bacterium]
MTVQSDIRHIAVFGDVHGHIRLVLRLASLWQQVHGANLHAILQVGDLGYWPDPANVDRATRRFAKDDPEEEGFWQYFAQPVPPLRDVVTEQILEGDPDDPTTLNYDVYWCHGNHEDFRALRRLPGSGQIRPVDAFERLWYVRSGAVVEVAAGLRLAAVGGGPDAGGTREGGSADGQWRLVDSNVTNRLIAGGLAFDVLLSHCGPVGLGGETDRFGSPLLRAVIEKCRPAYHFFGHYRKPVPPSRLGSTSCWWLNDVNFRRSQDQRIEPGCMGILEWQSDQTNNFYIVDDPWFHAVDSRNWQSLHP